jgi:hypothetical protein
MTRDDKKPDERITLAPDRYPQSWAHGAFGSAYRGRTWLARRGDVVPRLKDDDDR